jgi:hypothetical protein
MADQPQNPNRRESTPPSSKNAPNYRDWIKQELKRIATLTGQVVTKERVALTIDELVNIEPRKLNNAFAAARLECKYFPTPAEIYEFIKREESKPRFLDAPGCYLEQEPDGSWIIVSASDQDLAWAGDSWVEWRRVTDTSPVRFVERASARKYAFETFDDRKPN